MHISGHTDALSTAFRRPMSACLASIVQGVASRANTECWLDRTGRADGRARHGCALTFSPTPATMGLSKAHRGGGTCADTDADPAGRGHRNGPRSTVDGDPLQ